MSYCYNVTNVIHKPNCCKGGSEFCMILHKWRVSRENRPVQGCKNWQFFGLQNCVKFVLFKVHEVLSYIWCQNNQKFDHLSGNNPSCWYTWQHFHHGRICTTLFWTLNRSIFPQHSSSVTLSRTKFVKFGHLEPPVKLTKKVLLSSSSFH